MVIFMAKTCSTWPEMVLVVPPARYFDALICCNRCTGPWTTKSWKKVEKIAKNQFSRPNLQGLVHLRGAKIWSKGPILMLFGSWEGFWNMPTCFQMFVEVFAAIRGAKNEIKQKTSFFSPIPLLKSSISKNEKCRAKTLTFLWFQCIFLTYWVSKMGKPLVPVAPTHLGHLGHPSATSGHFFLSADATDILPSCVCYVEL